MERSPGPTNMEHFQFKAILSDSLLCQGISIVSNARSPTCISQEKYPGQPPLPPNLRIGSAFYATPNLSKEFYALGQKIGVKNSATNKRTRDLAFQETGDSDEDLPYAKKVSLLMTGPREVLLECQRMLVDVGFSAEGLLAMKGMPPTCGYSDSKTNHIQRVKNGDDALRQIDVSNIDNKPLKCEMSVAHENTERFSVKGIMKLSWEMIMAIMKFLPRPEWRGLALTCKGLRLHLVAMVLREERITSSRFSDDRTLTITSVNSFLVLNRHWRLGPLFQPLNTICFSIPFDGEDRSFCLKLATDYFRSLIPGVQHLEHVHLSLGVVWDLRDSLPSMDYAILGSLLFEIHRSGCRKLTVMSVDLLGRTNRKEPSPDILLGNQYSQLHLESFSLESVAFSYPALTPWFMKQLNNATLSHLKLYKTGFTPAQLDIILCYVELPRLETLAIGDAWLASVVDFLRGCPRVTSVHFLELSPDLRVSDDTWLSLPDLRSIRGNASTIIHFISLLRDVSWDSFWEIEINTNVADSEEGDNEDEVPKPVRTLDVESCIEILEFLVLYGVVLHNLAIEFPCLSNFTSPLFGELPELWEVMHSCKVGRLRIQMRCDEDRENGELMDAMISWISHFHSIESVVLHSVSSRINVLDRFSLRSGLASIRPALAVRILPE